MRLRKFREEYAEWDFDYCNESTIYSSQYVNGFERLMSKGVIHFGYRCFSLTVVFIKTIHWADTIHQLILFPLSIHVFPGLVILFVRTTINVTICAFIMTVNKLLN